MKDNRIGLFIGKVKVFLAGILVVALCINLGVVDNLVKKSVAKESSKIEYIKDSQGLEYRFPRDDEAEIEDTNSWAVSIGNCKKKNIVIPDTFKGKKVTHVDWSGFLECDNLTSITIGKNVERMDGYAFKGCKKLKKVNFKGSTLTYIDSEAFSECVSLKQIDLPDSLKWMSDAVFSASGLERIVIPEKVESVWDDTFKDCSKLKKVTLKRGLKELRESSFENCSKIKKIVLPKSTECIGEEVFKGCKKLRKVKFKGKVKEIDSTAFLTTPFYKQRKKGKYGIVNGLLIEYDGKAQENLSIDGKKRINGEKIRGISGTVYSNKKKLKKVTIKNLDVISGDAFSHCKAEVCHIQNVDEITKNVFEYGSVNILKVKEIDRLIYSFDSLRADKYYATNIGEFKSAIPQDVEEVVIDGMKKKGDLSGLYLQERLKSAVIKGNISVIDGGSLEGDSSLETLTIETPLQVKWTYSMVYDTGWFGDCISLKDVYLKCGGIDESIKGVFPAGITLHVPAEQVEDYKKYVDCNVVVW